MNREQISRSDFPPSDNGYDRPSVNAHLEAVAAFAAALEAQVKALEVERDASRQQLEARSAPDRPPGFPEPDSAVAKGGVEADAPEDGLKESPLALDKDEVSARLVATRLALEGAEREQIREKLEATYDLEDTDSLIDDVLKRLV
ncbi:MAG: hypothetical protein WD181_05475 [Solirubrobacterales bacterium]